MEVFSDALVSLDRSIATLRTYGTNDRIINNLTMAHYRLVAEIISKIPYRTTCKQDYWRLYLCLPVNGRLRFTKRITSANPKELLDFVDKIRKVIPCYKNTHHLLLRTDNLDVPITAHLFRTEEIQEQLLDLFGEIENLCLDKFDPIRVSVGDHWFEETLEKILDVLAKHNRKHYNAPDVTEVKIQLRVVELPTL